MHGLLGRKIGMTRVFDEHGQQIPVTAIACGPCVVLQRKVKARDGYEAAQIGFGEVAEKRVNKPDLGLFRKINVAPCRQRCEVALDAGEDCKPGDLVTVKILEQEEYVDIIGITKGKGFQGVMRRHGMSGGAMTHGGHSKRRVGSVGCRELPGRIHKGKRMPGHMGVDRMTLQNLKLVRVRVEDNVVLVRGSVPGHSGSIVLVKKSLKRGRKS